MGAELCYSCNNAFDRFGQRSDRVLELDEVVLLDSPLPKTGTVLQIDGERAIVQLSSDAKALKILPVSSLRSQGSQSVSHSSTASSGQDSFHLELSPKCAIQPCPPPFPSASSDLKTACVYNHCALSMAATSAGLCILATRVEDGKTFFLSPALSSPIASSYRHQVHIFCFH